jgi:hypothetical protein
MADPAISVLAETDTLSIWMSDEPDGEVTYHLEFGNVTIHLFREELDEVFALLRLAEDRVGRG